MRVLWFWIVVWACWPAALLAQGPDTAWPVDQSWPVSAAEEPSWAHSAPSAAGAPGLGVVAPAPPFASSFAPPSSDSRSSEKPPSSPGEDVPPPEKLPSFDDLRAEIKKNGWKKGDFSIVPYGIIYFNMVYATQRTTPGSFTLYVPSATLEPESEFVADIRTTRLGFDLVGPKLAMFCDAQSGGKVEIDFQNTLYAIENKSTPMLRHAYAEVKNEDFRVLVGQTVDVISPLWPNTMQYSYGRDAGNIGYRRAQFRVERYLASSDYLLTTLQLSANQQVYEDGNDKISGEASGWPILEGRVAWTLGARGKDDLPLVFGVSGHIGEEQADVDGFGINQRRRTWSANLDLRMPISERFGLQAECFMGENLGAFLGGIGQGVQRVTLRPIRSRGGWISAWYDWTSDWHSAVGFTIDDPWNRDLPTRGDRIHNHAIFANATYDVTDKLLVGFEVSYFKTLYRDMLPGEAVRCEFLVKYGF